ncbi:zinc-binding dehydrogenase [Streptomyces sp. MST-110588]|uniref:quinone oxidoreductase family protein n=1 Tax=Streptomyces sp. MST-110588 TaxID=2833628 RepID=UPI001F5CD35A|nr:zinc-binding dehydrogenase [Streptomyces sp. MST-110588]UNO40799.1 zinc-binding dehydrogenase [Streptomyces sp. MST-110588]
MFAVYAAAPDFDDPLSGLVTGERPEPQVPPGWAAVSVRAASLNMHDISTLRGWGMPPERYPMILGCDGAGVLADGTEVVVHALIGSPGWTGPETLDPGRTVLSEQHQGSFADTVVVPARNLVPKPAGISFSEAACLPTAWLTAYRMLFNGAGVRPGQTVLVQGRERIGSIATAAIALAVTAGLEVWVTAEGRGRDLAAELGAHRVLGPGEKAPGLVDAVLDGGVDETGWARSLELLRPGGAVVCAGYRAGRPAEPAPAHALHRLIFGERRLVGSAMGTAGELADLLAFLDRTGLRPRIARELPLREAAEGFRAMLTGETDGKIVFSHGPAAGDGCG